jgi:signal transduction histidine kinase
MQIRARLTLQILLMSAIIMIVASTSIYLFSASYRKYDFNNRLRNKATNTAKLLFEVYNRDADLLLKFEKGNPVNLPNERITILDFLNDTIYTSDEHGDIAIRNDVLERIRLNKRVNYRQDNFEVTGILFTRGYLRYVIVAAATDDLGFLKLRNLKIILIIVCFVSLLMFFVAGWIYSGKALKPISHVIRQVEDISITSLNLRVPEGNGTDEIGRLAKTFNNMLERLEASFALQKEFIANASHELRTPLTSINGQLEVLMMKDRSTLEYRTALSSVLDDIKSLIDLSNRLLLIARTSAENPVNFKKKIRIDEIIWQVKDELKRFSKDCRINISIDDTLTDSDHMLITGDEYLLKTAVSNIIDNACKYSSDHAVDIRLERFEKGIRLLFRDKGIGISEEDITKIFEPFFRGSNAGSVQGSGIGLPLVSQIIKIHNGTIKLTSKKGEGTTVSILFPRT